MSAAALVFQAALLRREGRTGLSAGPGALGGAWTGTPPKTTVTALYTELKAQKGRPWPTRQFIDVLNDAVNKGILARAVSGPDFTSVADDGSRELLVPKEAPPTPKPTPPSTGRETSEVSMGLSELQDFVEDSAPSLTKLLAGASPEFAVRIKLKGKAAADLAAANEMLKKIKPDWGF